MAPKSILAIALLALTGAASAQSAAAPAAAAAATAQVSDASKQLAAPVVSFLKALIPDDSSVKMPNGAVLASPDGKPMSKADVVRSAMATVQQAAPQVAAKVSEVVSSKADTTKASDKYVNAFAKAQTLAQNQQSLQYVSPDAVKGGLAGAAKAAGKEVAAPADAAMV